MDDTNIIALMEKINKLEKEQEELQEKFNKLSQEQYHDHNIILEVQQQLNNVCKEIEEIKTTLTKKIEEGNKLILEQNKLMITSNEKHFDKIYKLIMVLIAALLILVSTIPLVLVPSESTSAYLIFPFSEDCLQMRRPYSSTDVPLERVSSNSESFQ